MTTSAPMREKSVALAPRVMNQEKPLTKVCAGCGRELPMSAFPKQNHSSDGHMKECRDCRRRHRTKSSSSVNPLEKFTARELMHELKRRGYEGDITYTQIHRIKLSDM